MREIIWITAFTLPAFITLMVISYMHGSIVMHEHMKAENEQYKTHYETLASNVDWLTFVDAEAKYQGRKK